MSDQDMQTMPVRELIKQIRAKEWAPGEILIQMVINVLANRLEQETDDADRYRHMRDNAAFQDRNGPGLYWYLPRWNRDLPRAERLDRAVDAAIREQMR